MRLRASAAAALVAAIAGGCGAEEETAPQPVDFFGVTAADVFATNDPGYRDRSLSRMARAGVRVVRQTFDWTELERAPGRYDFSFHDRYVADIARKRLRLLPILFGAPPFRSSAPAGAPVLGSYPPRSNAEFARFATTLARRYGPSGSFWRAHPELPDLPISSWQVWNEPNLPQYWRPRPDPRAYVRLLRATADAIWRVDPRAEIVAAGLPESRIGIPFTRYVTAMYDAGAKTAFDTLAVHAFGPDAAGAVRAVRTARSVMRQQGDGAPLWVTELGWASGGPPSPFTVGEGGQTQRVRDALQRLVDVREKLRLRGVIYFNWRDAPPFRSQRDFFGLHTGLLRQRGSAKPALGAYREVALP